MTRSRKVWEWLKNLPPVRWATQLPVSQKVLGSRIGRKLFNYEMISYIFFGVLTTAVNLIVYWVFDRMLVDRFYFALGGKDYDLGYLIANFIAWVAGVLFAFVTNKLFVFESMDRGTAKVAREFVLFCGARVLSLVFEMVWMAAAVSGLGMNSLLAKIIGSVVVVIMNYIFSKLFIFTKSKSNETKECSPQ